MMTLETTSQFRKDYKRAKKRGYNMALLDSSYREQNRYACRSVRRIALFLKGEDRPPKQAKRICFGGFYSNAEKTDQM